MHQFLSKYKIHTKLFAGFAVLLAILLLASSLIRLRLNEITDEIGRVLNQHRPIEQLALHLDARLDDTVAALGMFVSLHDETSAQRYQKELADVYRITGVLQQSELVMEHLAYGKVLDDIRHYIDELSTYGERLLQTADDEVNFPGLAFANHQLNPLSQEIQQLTTQFLQSEDIHQDNDNHELLLLKSDLRYYWVNVISSVRAYLAYRSERIVHDTRLYLDAVQETLHKIDTLQFSLSLEDESALHQFEQALTHYERSWKELQSIHSGAQWRTDSFLMRTRISPLFDQLEAELDNFIQMQQSTMDDLSNNLLLHSNQITTLADMFIILGIITGVGMALTISRIIARPIHQIAGAMENIASGEADLTQRLDASGRDEVARLAGSFNTFVIKAQHRAEEQHVLSALLHLSLKPTMLESYLEDALKRVIKTVTWLRFEPKGGIFLTHPEQEETLKLVSSYNFSSTQCDLCATVPYGQCLCGRAAEDRKIVFACGLDDRHDNHCDSMQPHGHYSVPIHSDNRLLGVLVLYLNAGHERSMNEEAFLHKVAEVLSMGISLRQTNAELMVAMQRAESFSDQLTNITANIPGIIYQCRRSSAGECRYPFVSHGTASLLGKSDDDPQSDIHRLFTDVHDQDRARLEETLKTASHNQQPINVEYRIHQADGGVRWVLCNALPRQSRDGQLLWDGILLDITDRKTLEQQLLQAQKLESVGQLAAGIAHEINTPTQYVQDNIRFLQEAFDDYQQVFVVYHRLREQLEDLDIPRNWLKPVDDTLERVDVAYLNEEVPQAFSQTLDGIRRISAIVSAMKEFSHPGTDAQQPVDINDVIKNVATVTRNEWKYVAALELNLSDDLPLPMGYRDKIGQVILNLIVNAAHAIADQINTGKFDKGTITIATRCRDGGIELRIGDNGPGIPPAIRGKIFDPFFTTKGVGKGTGQGLSIAHSIIVEQHQGTLSVEASAEGGAEFVIQLPVDKAAIELAVSS
ncbi:MAG: ATP-binding protein [Candidatus Thiodiazotropha sp.]